MTLISCPDCSTEISDLAPACPKCGRPKPAPATPNKPSSPFRALWAVLGFFAFFGFCGVLASMNKHARSDAPRGTSDYATCSRLSQQLVILEGARAHPAETGGSSDPDRVASTRDEAERKLDDVRDQQKRAGCVQ